MTIASNLVLPLAKGAFMLLSECSTVPEGNCSSPSSSWIDLLCVGAEDDMQLVLRAIKIVQQALEIESSAGSGGGEDKTHFRVSVGAQASLLAGRWG